ncbi:MAG: chemotaxis protein CheX [Chloroflexota bacterium]|jgi:chemotaxis protein CheX
MNVKFLNPFTEAAAKVLEAECGLIVTKGQLSMQKSSLTAEEVTVLISLIGQVEGTVLYGMNTKTALGLVSRVMDQEFLEFDDLARSGVAELGNVITGQATIKLSQAGYASQISPPTIIEGRDIEISTLDFQRVVVPLNTDVGLVTVHLGLRESRS